MSPKSLWKKITGKDLDKDEMALSSIGGGSVAIRVGESVGFVDPFLSNWSDGEWVRRFPPEIDPRSVDKCDFVLITHEHEDHFDPETLRGLLEKNDFEIIAPVSTLKRLEADENLKRHLTIVEPGDVVEAVNCEVTVLESNDQIADAAVGFLLSTTGKSVCFLGDSLFDPKIFKSYYGDLDVDVFVVAIGNNPPGEKYYLSVDELKETAEIFSSSIIFPVHWDLWTKTYIDPHKYDFSGYSNIKIADRGELFIV